MQWKRETGPGVTSAIAGSWENLFASCANSNWFVGKGHEMYKE